MAYVYNPPFRLDSGSGKTMVLQALLYTHGRHQNGQIFVGGQPIVTTMLSRQEQERRIVNWRQKFGMVDQDPRFFPISIHDNVALGSGMCVCESCIHLY
jgi:ABC-type phosphate transport system ATPase subunit